MLRCRAFLIGFFAFVLSFSLHAESKKVTLGTSVWPPYVMPTDLPDRGYAYDLVTEAFERMGYTVSILVMPWEEAREKTIQGKIDGLFPEYESSQNLKHFIYSDSFLAGPLVMYKKVDGVKISIPQTNNQVDFFKQMHKYRFGIVDGYINDAAFDDNATLKKFPVVDDKANLEQLYHGDVDLILVDALNAQYLLEHDFPAEYQKILKRVGPVLNRPSFHIVFSKKVKNIETINRDFNEGLRQLKDEDITYRIMEKYLYLFINNQAVPKKIKSDRK